MKKSEALDAAADEVLKGWCQKKTGSYDRPTGNVCAMGAIARIAYRDNKWTPFYTETVHALSSIALDGMVLDYWNDVPGRTAGEVADVMRTAAKELREVGE